MTGRLPERRAHRGSALMMVITALATAVVLSTAYVASRSDGVVVGTNLAAGSRARVEAESALALTVAALTTDERWRTAHRDGVLLERIESGRTVRVELIDLATCAPPGPGTVDVKAVISTVVDGVERGAEADLFVPLPTQAGAIDVDLGEFAVFGGGTVTVRSEATVEPWEASPAISRGDPIRVATAEGGAGDVRVEGEAAIVSGVEYAPAGRSGGFGPLPVDRLPDAVAVPRAAPPEELTDALMVTDPTGRFDRDLRTETLELNGGSRLELAGGADLLVAGDLVITGGAVLHVDGDSQIVVLGDARVENGTIEVEREAGLAMHVAGDLDFRHATVIEPGGDESTWVPAIDRVRFLPLEARETIPRWRIRGRSLVKGEIYAPNVDFSLQGRAILIGRVAAQYVVIEGRSSLFYDPSLDDRNGYTAPDLRAYDETGDLHQAIAELEDLAPESLAEASAELGMPVASADDYACPPAVERGPEAEATDDWSGSRRSRGQGRWGARRWNADLMRRHENWSVLIRRIGVEIGG